MMSMRTINAIHHNRLLSCHVHTSSLIKKKLNKAITKKDIESIKPVLQQVAAGSLPFNVASRCIDVLLAERNTSHHNEVINTIAKVSYTDIVEADVFMKLRKATKYVPSSLMTILSSIIAAQRHGVAVPVPSIQYLHLYLTAKRRKSMHDDELCDEEEMMKMIQEMMLGCTTPAMIIMPSRTLDMSLFSSIFLQRKDILRATLSYFLDGVYDTIMQANLNSPPTHQQPRMDQDAYITVLQDLELHRRPMLGISSLVIIAGGDRSDDTIKLMQEILNIMREDHDIMCQDIWEEKISYEMGNRYKIPFADQDFEKEDLAEMMLMFKDFFYGSLDAKIPAVLHVRPRNMISFATRRLLANAGKTSSSLDYLLVKEYDILDHVSSSSPSSPSSPSSCYHHIMSPDGRGFNDETVARIKRIRLNNLKRDAKSVFGNLKARITGPGKRLTKPIRNPAWK